MYRLSSTFSSPKPVSSDDRNVLTIKPPSLASDADKTIQYPLPNHHYQQVECQLTTVITGVRTRQPSRWFMQQLLGGNHWCASWLEELCEADGNFLLHWREQHAAYVHFLCLVRLAWLSNNTTLDIAEQAILLQQRSQKSLLRELYHPYPIGLLQTLSKLGQKALTKKQYALLLQLQGNPNKCAYLAHASRIKTYHLQWLDDFPTDLLNWRVLCSIHKSHHYAKLNYLVLLIKNLAASNPETDALQSVKQLKSLSQLAHWFRRHVNSLPFPAPPWKGNDWLKPIRSASALKCASRDFQNCITDYTREVLLGHYYFYQSMRGPAVVLLIRDPLLGWHLHEINGVKNQAPNAVITDAIEMAFREAEFPTDQTLNPEALWDEIGDSLLH